MENPIEVELSNPQTPRPARPLLRTIMLVAIIASVIGGLIGGSLIYLLLLPGRSNVVARTSIPSGPINLSVETAVTEVVESVGPAVVTVINQLPPQRTFFGNLVPRSSTGSGVIISTDGYVVTNNHVVEGSESLEVILANGDVLSANLIGVDVYADLAVLQVDGLVPVAAPWGNSDGLRPGEPVIAIGSPLGDFTNTVTLGVVSAMERSIELDQDYNLEGLIQTDAAINQGNSGGPLLNTSGQVVGINTLIVRGSGNSGAVAEGLGFAIPSNMARAIAEQLIQEGYFARPYTGIRWVNVTPSLASRYRLPTEWGIFITEVDPDGPANKAGLRRGDIITSLNSETIDDDHPFRNVLFRYQPGESVTFTYMRETDQRTVDVVLGAMTSSPR